MIVLLASACATQIKIDADYEAAAVSMLATYRTYGWLPRPPGWAMSPDEAVVAPVVTDAINETLTAKGYRRADRQPQFHVSWDISLEAKRRITTVPITYERYRFPGMPSPTPPLRLVHEYSEGTLIIDVLDAPTNSLVWRGTAEAEVLPSTDRATLESRIREAVRLILQRFPPR